MENSGSPINSVDNELFIYECILVASFVVLYYDYILTLSDELDRYWVRRRKMTIATILFFLNRYLSIFGYMPFFISYFWPSSGPNRLQTCLRFGSYHMYLVVVVQVNVATISILRTYALYGRSRYILVLLIAATATAAGFGLWCVLGVRKDTYSEEDLPTRSCLLPLSDESSKRQLWGWAGLLGFEILVFALTLYKSIYLATKTEGRYRILDIMLRDGALYFGIIALSSISVIVSFRLNKKHERGMTATLTNALASSVISRLMFNLRDPRLASGNVTPVGTRPILSILRFMAVNIDTSWSSQIDSMLSEVLDSIEDTSIQ